MLAVPNQNDKLVIAKDNVRENASRGMLQSNSKSTTTTAHRQSALYTSELNEKVAA